MFDGAILDVAIGMLLIFLAASLMASAMVEVVAGFLHRRSKHLWDTLDLLLGNTSPAAGGSRSIVDELYQQPFITGLVRPTDRVMFDPASTATPKPLPRRAAPPKKVRERALVATRTLQDEEMRRRFYGPIHLDSREFTNALLAVLRPRGDLDRALIALNSIRDVVADQETGVDVALDDVDDLLAELHDAARELRAREIGDAIDTLRNVGDTIDIGRLNDVVRQAESALIGFFTTDPTRTEIVAALGVVPQDLRVKLIAVLTDAGEDIVAIRSGIEDWYDRTMAAASSWYRKQTRWFLFIAGLVLAVSLNVDGVHAVGTLYSDESTRASLVALADEVSQTECSNESATATDDVDPEATSDSAAGDGGPAPDDAVDRAGSGSAIDLDCFRDAVGGSIALPVGWDDVDTSPGGWALRVLGWFLIAGAVTVGAPFWFDLLGRALRLRKRQTASGAEES